MMDVIEAPLAPQEAKDEGCLTVGCDYPAGTACTMMGCPGRSRLGDSESAQSIRGSTIGPASDVVSSFHEVTYGE